MNLFIFIIRRLIILVPIIFGVLIIVFIIGRVLPSDPLIYFIGQEADQELINKVKHDLKLDRSIWIQFIYYLKDISNGSLGMSWSTRNPVSIDLMSKLPATFELVIFSLLFTVLLSIPLGIISAVKKDTIIDHLSRIFVLSGVSIPNFWLGLILIYLFYAILGWSPPPMGRLNIGIQLDQITGFLLIDSILTLNIKAFISSLNYLILPVITLSALQIAQLTRITRSSMIEVLNSEYIQSAKAQGLSKNLIIYRLALKNSLLVPITQIGIIAGNTIGSAVIVEIVFAWPGAGSWAIDAALAGDFAPIQAFAAIMAIARVIIFLMTDIAYKMLDPRIDLY